MRGNATHGDGVYKSRRRRQDLEATSASQDSYHIGAVRVHPKNPDIVYVAALGHLWGPNEMRGVYRTTDGGATWKQVLKRSNTRAPSISRWTPTIRACSTRRFWEISRKPWRMDSGGPGSGLFKPPMAATPGPRSRARPACRSGVLGRIGVTVSPANPERVWALVEAADGGVFRSDNGGRNWTRVNEQNILRQRAWYYAHIFADPQNADTVYALNVGFYDRSTAAARSPTIRPPHGDNHDLWIAPNDPQPHDREQRRRRDHHARRRPHLEHAWKSADGAVLPRGARQRFPVPHLRRAAGQHAPCASPAAPPAPASPQRDWYDVGGGESGWIAPDPRNSQIVYAGSYDGLLTRHDHRTGQSRNINAWPDNPMGYGAEAMKYRFQWSFPIVFSPHDPKTLYIGVATCC